MRILGIDLGTTNTAASIEGYVISLSGKGGSLLPSVVSFLPNGRTLVGLAAARRRALDPVNTIFSSKRIVGRRWTSTGTQDFRGRYPFDLIESGKDGIAFRTRAGSFTPTEVASMLLSAVFDQVKDRAWSLEGRAVTVPAAFGPGQRNATLEAARMAGLDDVFLVDEPMATATAYRGQPGPEPGRVAIYDLGGGTFNFALWTAPAGSPACSPTPAICSSAATTSITPSPAGRSTRCSRATTGTCATTPRYTRAS